tara:strand:- start:234 stop:953 length:720 start_codon:yes stop_codon:yes gene_type:complete
MSDFQIDRGTNKPKVTPAKKVGKDIPSNSIANFSEEQLEKWLDENGERILKNYYRRNHHTFSIQGGGKLSQHDESEYSMSTSSGQGILFTNTGNCKMLGNASVEVISGGKKNAGQGFDKKSDAGIVIYAKDGVIHIEAKHGDITIRSSENVNIEAKKNINLTANKNINVDCVNYKNTNTGNYSVITEEKTMIHTGTELSLHCDTDNIQTSSGFDEDLAGKDLRENLINEHKVIDQLSEG